MIDHLTFFRKNIKKNLLILAGPEQYPARAIVEEYRRRIRADNVFILWADEENLLENLISKLSSGIFAKNVVWIKGFERVKNYGKLLNEIVNSAKRYEGCVISVYDDAERLKTYESDKVLLINMRNLTPNEFDKWIKKHLPWVISRPDLKNFLTDIFKGMSLSEVYLEIEKLKLYSDKPARESLNLIWQSYTPKIFELTHNILNGNLEDAYAIIDELRNHGDNPANIVAFLLRELEVLVEMKLGFQVPRNKYLRFRRYFQWISEGELSEALNLLKTADFNIKGRVRGNSQWAYLKLVVKDLIGLLGKKPYEDSRNKTIGLR